MSRMSITKKMITYLEEKVNCENAIKFADRHYFEENDNLKINELIINSVPLAYEIIHYNDDSNNDGNNSDSNNDNSDNDNSDINTDKKNSIWVKNMFEIFDFISEANYLGYEYFPHLYGVLNCHEGENSRIYLYYELFEKNLEDLIGEINHPSEWYDIVFQMIMTNYYLLIVNNCIYDGSIKNHLCKKLVKPYYKKYEIDGKELNINHKFLIVLKDFNHISQINNTNDNISTIDKKFTNIEQLIKYIELNKTIIKTMPSNKIINLLRDVTNNPKNSMLLIQQYYVQISQK